MRSSDGNFKMDHRCMTACTAHTMLVGVLVTVVACAAYAMNKEHEFAGTRATSVGIVGIASLKVVVDGKAETVGISQLASEDQLLATLQSEDALRDAPFSKADVERFLHNRALIVNFMRCRAPPGVQLTLRQIRSGTTGSITADVAVHLPSGHRVDLASVMIGQGFAIPEQDLWSRTRETDDPTYAMDSCNAAREAGIGLWTTTRPREDGYEPLSLELDPSLAVPLQTIWFETRSSSEWPIQQPCIGMTVIVGTECDVYKIAAAEAWINTILREYVSGFSAAEVNTREFVTLTEQEMLSRLSEAREWGVERPTLTRVQVRLNTFSSEK